jgi:hypothetical protein
MHRSTNDAQHCTPKHRPDFLSVKDEIPLAAPKVSTLILSKGNPKSMSIRQDTTGLRVRDLAAVTVNIGCG